MLITMKKYLLVLVICTVSFFTVDAVGQINPGVYRAMDTLQQTHELKFSDNYFIYTIYNTGTPNFVKTMGGFYRSDGREIKAELEFNSNYAQDQLNEWKSEYSVREGGLFFDALGQLSFAQVPELKQELDGAWLFATRGPDTGQERRGEAQERKTLKFLMDGTFQWIAYHTGTMDFRGTGGGRYTAEDGKYTEVIEFFSRDASRVGAELQFDYRLEGGDWHHQGKNSKGEPMYEIWSIRK